MKQYLTGTMPKMAGQLIGQSSEEKDTGVKIQIDLSPENTACLINMNMAFNYVYGYVEEDKHFSFSFYFACLTA